MLLAPIVLFVYKRPKHTKQVVDALRQNVGAKESALYVFSDAAKCDDDIEAVQAVRNYIKSIDGFASVTVCERERNYGLADNIVDGVTQIINKYGKIIVLEDDCVPTLNFLSFMQQSLAYYEKYDEVYCVSGYAWPIRLYSYEYDVYCTGRISSWGWGTWLDRWNKNLHGGQLLRNIMCDKYKSEYLAIWGNDLTVMLCDNITAKNDSWAIHWALTVIDNLGRCIAPYNSFIKNIGFDNTGVHCCVSKDTEKEIDALANSLFCNQGGSTLRNAERKYRYPVTTDITISARLAFSMLYGSKIACIENYDRVAAVVYGLGNFYINNEDFLIERYKITSFIDKRRYGYYAGYKIYKKYDVCVHGSYKVIIMLSSVQESIKIAKSLSDQYGVLPSNIVLGVGLKYKWNDNVDPLEIIKYIGRNKFLVKIGGFSCKISSEDEFNNVCEVFQNKVYNYKLNNNLHNVVFDIGMNIGAASLFFLSDKNTEKVYAFEPFPFTFMSGKDNLGDNCRLAAYCFGLSNVDDVRKVVFNHNMSCGMSTLPETNELSRLQYKNWKLLDKCSDRNEVIRVKKASQIIGELLSRHKNVNYVLKIDCEGEECNILSDLSEYNLLDKFSLIMMEWHFNNKFELLKILESNNFVYVCFDRSLSSGLVYAYKQLTISES